MNRVLRWNLLLGCAVLAGIQLPDGAEVLAQDFQGPYSTCTPSGDRGLPGPALGDESTGWQTAVNDFDPARIGADTEATLDDDADSEGDAERSTEGR